MKGKESVAMVQGAIVRKSSAVELMYSRCSYGQSVHFLKFKFFVECYSNHELHQFKFCNFCAPLWLSMS